MEVTETQLKDLLVLNRSPKGDSRGYLQRMFCRNTLAGILGNKNIRQINHTLTVAEGTIRGLHFQFPPYAETKIVCCMRGEIFDVAVDLRKGSSTFLQHYSTRLSAESFSSLVIPEGFAHGFQTLSNDCEVLYFHTSDYQPSAECGFNALDPRLKIQWPKDVLHRSARDAELTMIPDNFWGIEI